MHIRTAAQRMNALVRDLLDLSKASRKSLCLEAVSLDLCLDDALRMLMIPARESDAQISRDPLPTVITDRTLVTQVFQNLISNAIKFTRPGEAPAIRVAVEPAPDDGFVISVTDSGIGVPEDGRGVIFEPFERLQGRTEYEGTGIGLAICRRALERLGGDIWVENSDDGGARFSFVVRSHGSTQQAEFVPFTPRAAPSPAG